MKSNTRLKAVARCVFWTLVAGVFAAVIVQSYASGQMTSWFYHKSNVDGYAVNAGSFEDATRDDPAALEIVDSDKIEGLQAVAVKAGDRLPEGANGVIETKIVEEKDAAKRRAEVDGGTLKVLQPTKQEKKSGIKYTDTFMHKGIKTWEGAAIWNVCMIIGLGLALGFMAESATDVIGLKLEKIEHFQDSAEGSHV